MFAFAFGGLAAPSGLGIAISNHSRSELGLSPNLNRINRNTFTFPKWPKGLSFDFSRTRIPFSFPKPKVKIAKPTKPKDAHEWITRDYKKLKCVSDLFQNIDFSNEGKITAKLAEPRTDAAGAYQTPPEADKFDANKTKGCMAVWWEKEVYENDYWKGQWDLIWVLSDGINGRILFNNVSIENGKLYSDGIAYKLKQEGGKWKIKGRVKKDKTIVTEGNKDNLIIKPGTSKQTTEGEYWGFGNFDPNKVCSKNNSNCKQLRSTSKATKKWTLTKEGCSEFLYNNWTSNRSSWVDSTKGLFPSHTFDAHGKVQGCF